MEDKRGIREWIGGKMDKFLLAIRRAKWVPLFLLFAFFILIYAVNPDWKDLISGLTAFSIGGIMIYKLVA